MRLLTGSGSLLGLCYSSMLVGQSAAYVDKWTSEDFDWSGPNYMRTGEVPSGVWMNASSIPPTTNARVLAVNNHTTTNIETHQFVAVAAFLGFAWRAATLAVTGVAVKDTVSTCKDTFNGDASAGQCVKGVLTTAVAFGGSLGPAKKLAGSAGRTLFPHRFLADGTVDLEMNVLHRRDVDDDAMRSQLEHHDAVRHVLRSLSHADSQEPEFLGYADDDHRLMRRDGGLHPMVPTFRFEHAKLGSMEIASRDTMNGTFFSMAPSGSSMHLLGRRQKVERMRKMKRDGEYDHELLSGGGVEARFDTEASQADPADISTDAGQLFDTFKPNVDCFVGDGGYDGGHILDAQMYDQTNHATFGFGSVGIYNNDEDADDIESKTPEGMPLSSCG